MQFSGNCNFCGASISSGVSASSWKEAITNHSCPEKKLAKFEIFVTETKLALEATKHVVMTVEASSGYARIGVALSELEKK